MGLERGKEGARVPLYVVWAALSVAYAALTFAIFYKFAGIAISDTFAHLSNVERIWVPEGFGTFFVYTSYPGWHALVRLLLFCGVAPQVSAAASSALFSLLTALVAFYVSDLVMGRRSAPLAIVAALAALFVSAAWLSPYNENIYYGQGSPTIWHNPTYVAVRPFALLSCLLLFRMIGDKDARLGRCVAYAVVTLVALLMKPSFFQVQAPAVFVWLVVDLAMRRDWRFARNIALTFVPAIGYMLVQFWIMFYSPTGGAGSGGVALCFFDVYRATNPTLLVSILLLLAFPLYSGIVLYRDFFAKGSPFLFLAIMVAVGFCEYSFLMESGDRMMHGNFSWGYMLAVFAYWAFVLPLFLKRAFVDRRMPIVLAVIGCALAAWHLGSGVAYYCQLLLDPTGTMMF